MCNCWKVLCHHFNYLIETRYYCFYQCWQVLCYTFNNLI
nr:MAG TPA: hypothetical protein [Caudoviricetes sp.]